MSNKQQTAVEWLIERLLDLDYQFAKKLISLDVYSTTKVYLQEKAKEMEKQQIVKGVNFGTNQWVRLGVLNGEEYYNKTYGGNK